MTAEHSSTARVEFVCNPESVVLQEAEIEQSSTPETRPCDANGTL